MADVFISYCRHDREWVEQFVQTLERKGWSVWFDLRLKIGEWFRPRIQRELTTAHCVVVVWSRQAVASRWVCSEAEVAVERGILVPISIDGTRPPVGLTEFHTANLADWKPDQPHEQYESCIATIAERVAGCEAAATAAMADDTRRSPAPAKRRIPWRAAALLLLTVTLPAGWWLRDPWQQTRLHRAIERLALNAEAIPAARFSVAPRPQRAAMNAAPGIASPAVADAAGEVVRLAEGTRQAKQATAFAEVILGRHDSAVQQLEAAVAEWQTDVSRRSDLAAARYEEAMRRSARAVSSQHSRMLIVRCS